MDAVDKHRNSNFTSQPTAPLTLTPYYPFYFVYLTNLTPPRSDDKLLFCLHLSYAYSPVLEVYEL